MVPTDRRRQVYQFSVMGLLLCIPITGCSQQQTDPWLEARSAVVAISGTVMLDGKPAESAIVVLFPAKGSATAKPLGAAGLTNSSGRFHLTTYDDGDGAVPGHYVVTVKKIQRLLVKPAGGPLNPAVFKEIPLMAARFGELEKSPLNVTITAPTDEVVFNVTSK